MALCILQRLPPPGAKTSMEQWRVTSLIQCKKHLMSARLICHTHTAISLSCSTFRDDVLSVLAASTHARVD